MIRSLLIVILIVAFLILSIPILIVEWIIGKFNPYARDISSLRIVQFMFKLILFVSGTKVTVIGEDRIPKDTPVLYVGNHRSYFDVVLTYARCPGLTGYVAKDSMKKIPLLSSWMKRLHCLFLNRSDIKEGLKTILQGIDQMKNGVSMCIFPEGTRNKTEDEMLPFKAGSLKLSEKTGCPIVPMAITNSADILENHFPKVKPTHVILQYGTPIYLDQLSADDRKHLAAYTQNTVHELLADNRKYL